MTMNNWPARFCICVAAAMTLWPVATVKADDNDTVIRSGEYADDVFVNGSHISVDAILQQDLFAAGEHVEVSGQVKGDLFAAGGQLDLASKVLGTLLAAGGQITVEGDVEDSAVVFCGDVEIKSKINGDVFLTAGKAVTLNLAGTDLVVLSACQTGVGDVRNGEGVYGLQRAFQEAGSKAVLSTLWSISDDATTAFMRSFYNRFLQGTHPQQALQETQEEFIKNEQWQHPYYWAPFVMVGKD